MQYRVKVTHFDNDASYVADNDHDAIMGALAKLDAPSDARQKDIWINIYDGSNSRHMTLQSYIIKTS